MTRVLPIPRKDLPHTAVRIRTGGTAWEPPVTEETAMSRVRVQGREGLALSADGERGASSMVLFYDCVNSRPAGLEFRPGDRVRFGDREFAVSAAAAVASDALNPAIHHWEVALG